VGTADASVNAVSDKLAGLYKNIRALASTTRNECMEVSAQVTEFATTKGLPIDNQEEIGRAMTTTKR
jgi:hypothetical protein